MSTVTIKHGILIKSEIKNLIFDLGGVLLDLHLDRTHEAFARLANCSVDEIKLRIAGSTCFIDHEKGLISDAEFRDALRRLMQQDRQDEEIDAAWNAILGDIPLDRLQMLKRLRKDYQVFLLSNTNSIHLPRFAEIVRSNSGEPSLESFFDRTYYSHVLKMRKPDAEIFQYVLDDRQLIPGQTLFLDDLPANLTGAEKTGIKTFHVDRPQSVLALFS